MLSNHTSLLEFLNKSISVPDIQFEEVIMAWDYRPQVRMVDHFSNGRVFLAGGTQYTTRSSPEIKLTFDHRLCTYTSCYRWPGAKCCGSGCFESIMEAGSLYSVPLRSKTGHFIAVVVLYRTSPGYRGNALHDTLNDAENLRRQDFYGSGFHKRYHQDTDARYQLST